jgi:hypothetical protein
MVSMQMMDDHENSRFQKQVIWVHDRTPLTALLRGQGHRQPILQFGQHEEQ